MASAAFTMDVYQHVLDGIGDVVAGAIDEAFSGAI
jgi:hypothetical protein